MQFGGYFVPTVYRSLAALILLLPVSFCSSDSGEPPMVADPSISVSAVEFIEGNGDSNNTVDLVFELSTVSTKPVEFSYATEGKSAVANEDFEPASGAVIIEPGTTSKSISLSIIGDQHLEFDERYLVKVSNIVNATMVISDIEITILDDDSFEPEQDADGFVTPIAYPSMELAWSDEFDDVSINEADWNFEEGNGCPNLCGWGNAELQWYSVDNTQLDNGNMVITAENPSENRYTSSRLTTKGKQEFKYGRIDIRAKLPFGRGIWPALWMLGTNIDDVGWPVCGEIDIMEMVGHQAATVHGTAHYDVNGHQFTGNSRSLGSGIYADQFHIFTILWQPGQIEWFIDYSKFYTLNAKDVGFTYPFDAPFFFIANVAVGGQWPGDPDATTQFPQTLEVDYIRVFQTAGLE
ncbi:MAG: hypothetical protein DHS20C17_21830 [Cyclobacteriaceae bacterium]|nr:MAG: hypothetical protein DHS20C17_21830 [Cyclobacteriaceae bacterium]